MASRQASSSTTIAARRVQIAFAMYETVAWSIFNDPICGLEKSSENPFGNWPVFEIAADLDSNHALFRSRPPAPLHPAAQTALVFRGTCTFSVYLMWDILVDLLKGFASVKNFRIRRCFVTPLVDYGFAQDAPYGGAYHTVLEITPNGGAPHIIDLTYPQFHYDSVFSSTKQYSDNKVLLWFKDYPREIVREGIAFDAKQRRYERAMRNKPNWAYRDWKQRQPVFRGVGNKLRIHVLKRNTRKAIKAIKTWTEETLMSE